MILKYITIIFIEISISHLLRLTIVYYMHTSQLKLYTECYLPLITFPYWRADVHEPSTTKCTYIRVFKNFSSKVKNVTPFHKISRYCSFLRSVNFSPTLTKGDQLRTADVSSLIFADVSRFTSACLLLIRWLLLLTFEITIVSCVKCTSCSNGCPYRDLLRRMLKLTVI